MVPGAILTGASEDAEVGFRPFHVHQEASVFLTMNDKEDNEVEPTKMPARKAESTGHNR